MEIKQYLNKRKVLYNHLLDFIDNQDDAQNEYQHLLSDIQSQNITENKNEFQPFLHLLVLISNNHHHYSNFFSKIDQILSFLSPKIIQTFSNSEIFNIFYKNKRVLLFFIKNNVFKVDENLMKSVQNQNFSEYFTDFDINHANRKEKGENNSYICQLIRDDSIEEFITYISQNNISLTNTIKQSIYETNSFIMNKNITLLEYSFFFGSINIVKYMLNNGIKLTKSLWPFAIHSNNPEMIQLLEDENIVPQNNKESQKYLEESIKCHHNEIATYIEENYIHNDNNLDNNILVYSLHFYNYAKLSECEINNIFFLYACKYNYVELVKLLLNEEIIDINFTLTNIIN